MSLLRPRQAHRRQGQQTLWWTQEPERLPLQALKLPVQMQMQMQVQGLSLIHI